MDASPRSFRHSGFQGRIGLARTDITPPIGIYARNWGAANHDLAESVHRPLLLSALSLAEPDKKNELVLIEADLGWWKSPQAFAVFQKQLLSGINIPRERLIFALSHTHAGPPLMEADPTLAGTEMIPAWMESVVEKSIELVQKARETSQDAILEWHTGSCQLATNRELPDPSQDRIVCGFNPDETADSTLLLGRISDLKGNLLATLVNYACHPTTLAWENKAISPDYIGAMRQTMEAVTQAPAFFLLGVCGDLAPRHQYVGDTEIPDAHGRQLGYAALATLSDMNRPGHQLSYHGVVESGAPLAVWKSEPVQYRTTLKALDAAVELPLKDWPTASELEAEQLASTDRFQEERLRRKLSIRRFIGDGKTFHLPLSVWQIGDAILVGNCCEPYSALQQKIRAEFPEQAVVCMNLVNGSIGYLPPSELYETDVYPVWQTPFDKGCFEATLATFLESIHDIIKQ